MGFRIFNFLKTMMATTKNHRSATLTAAAARALSDGELEKAVQLYGTAIDENSKDADSHYQRGNAYFRLGQWADALLDYDSALEIDSRYANAFCNRGAVLQQLGRFDEALASYDLGLAQNPSDAFAHYNRASVLREMQRLDEALVSYDAAVRLKAEYFEAYVNRGHILRELSRYAAAITSYDKATELRPGYAEAYQCRGHCLAQLRQFDAALESYDRALAIDSAYSASYQGRLYCLVNLGRFEAAIAIYDHALTKDPNQKYLAGMRLHAKMQICDWDGLGSQLKHITEGIGHGVGLSPPFPLLSATDSPELQLKAAGIWMREQAPPDDTLGPIAQRRRGSKIRLGYFSADFRDHAVAQATAELFETHHRGRFEVIGFSFGPRVQDAMRARLSRAFDQLIDVSDETEGAVAAMARKIGIDIAIDLGGYTEFCRSKIFALRAAPIQVNFLGYPGTLAAPYMDYLIADRVVVPPDQRDQYTEKIVYLPHSYIPHDSKSAISQKAFSRDELGLPARGFIFCCFNKKYKITPEIFESWMRILTRVPASVLWLSLDSNIAARNLRLAASRCGVDPARLLFANRVEALAEHLARLRAADLFLDTLPYSAHATATDALWAGLPLLSLMGKSFASRVSASLLRSAELTELVATSNAQYEEIAVRIAKEPSLLSALKAKLAANSASTPLFDTQRFTANLERAFEMMQGKYWEGLPPDRKSVV